ncbi:MSHA pilin protein MshA [Moritella sp. JT01]|uniref:type II secretion system protein n=1 Tax=Moritella sp. JT01 TaxID=756698 RepID=UPI000796E78F|nr:type II secretion system protein [Moritella sp. JT01]KXO13794.1 MSHA pilin protein MshA [Moritella sp. JT01]
MRNQGFTLLELVIVIIVLGILAAAAVPKFINIQDDAKDVSLHAASGALNSAANLVHYRAQLDGVNKLERSTVKINGEVVNLFYSYPYGTPEDINKIVTLEGFEVRLGKYIGTTIINLEDSNDTGDACIQYQQASSNSSFKIYEGTLIPTGECL